MLFLLIIICSIFSFVFFYFFFCHPFCSYFAVLLLSPSSFCRVVNRCSCPIDSSLYRENQVVSVPILVSFAARLLATSVS
ncbi:hypothetical protein B0T19DRAFT_284928 [Cercophora scortea]|uniref:Uncharacterized protein n=1 Tax=Cercophora scortea TaxID=314031 RepID=A0AAE0I856_9PEZI|nr:hypothetical protein B0T19DRAFT_284928 [Cercophora scortea]